MSVNRYDPEVGSCMYGQDDGAYVTFADYEQAVALRDAKIAKAIEALDFYGGHASDCGALIGEACECGYYRAFNVLRAEAVKPVDPPAQSSQTEPR